MRGASSAHYFRNGVVMKKSAACSWLFQLCIVMFVLCAKAFAQTPGISEAVVSTSNLEGTVTLVVAGVKTVFPLPGVNASTTSGEGTVQHDAANVNVGVSGIANLATVDTPHSQANFAATQTTTTLAGTASASNISLAQNAVQSTSVSGRGYCTFDSAGAIRCVGSTSLGSVIVNGVPVSIPQQPIPIGYPLATVSATLAVNLPGLGLLVNIPVSGALKVNDYIFSGVGSKRFLAIHAPLHLELAGSLNVLSVGLVSAQIDLRDVTETIADTTSVATTPIVSSVSPDAIDCSNLADGYYADPSSQCSPEFFACQSGKSISKTCPAGTVFNSSEIECVVPNDDSYCPAPTQTSVKLLQVH
ncbi:hypothetical protein C7H84_35995 [Burkholderia sp. Nafp2/4-1b]|nr:hypothetical protein C7H84_35995 [Burkholderia sp. Nafp2/4-1b]